MSNLLEKNKSTLLSPLSLILAGLFIGLSVLGSFYITNLTGTAKLRYDEQLFFAKLLIVVLGIVCTLPFVYEIIKYGINEVEFFSPTVVLPLLYFAIFGLGSLELVARGDVRVMSVVGCSVAGILFYYLGILFVRVVFDFTKRQEELSHISIEWDPYLLKLLIVGFVTISIVALAYHALKTGLPIFYTDLEEKRVMIQQQVSNYVIFFIRLVTPAFFFYLSYGLLYHKVNRMALGLFFCTGFLILLSLANRHDIFTISIGTMLIYNFAGKRIKLTKLIPILVAGLIILMSIGFYRLATLTYVTPEKEFLLKTAGTDRILMFFTYAIFQFTIYPQNFALYLDSFPKVLPFESGYSFVRAIITILPGHQDLLDEYVKSKLGLVFLGGGINPTILGELYANFGYIGLLGMSFYGAILALLFYRMLKYRDGVSILFYSFGLSSLLLGMIGGFFSFFLPFYYIIVITFVHLFTRRKTIQYFNSQFIKT